VDDDQAAKTARPGTLDPDLDYSAGGFAAQAMQVDPLLRRRLTSAECEQL
jgi:hypothetical protein